MTGADTRDVPTPEAMELAVELTKWGLRGLADETIANLLDKFANDRAAPLQKVADAARNVGLTSHSGHWDKTGGAGSGCPECKRQREWFFPLAEALRALDSKS